MTPMGCQNETITRNFLPSATVEQASNKKKYYLGIASTKCTDEKLN